MGCVVNGPGEAREADVGIAGGKGEGLLFRKGEVVRKVPEDELADALMAEVEKLMKERACFTVGPVRQSDRSRLGRMKYHNYQG